MRTPILAVVLLAVLLFAGIGLGAFFYVSAQSRCAPAALGDVAEAPVEDTAPAKPSLPVAPPIDYTPDKSPPPRPLDAPLTPKAEPAKPETDNVPVPGAGDPEKAAAKAEEDKRAREQAELAKLLEKLKEGIPDFESTPLHPHPEAEEQVDFEAEVSGYVVDSHGVRVAGADVYCDISESRERGRIYSITMMSGGGNKVATTSAGGEFNFKVKRKVGKDATVNANLSARARGYASSETAKHVLKHGEHTKDVALKLRVPGSVRGIVTATGGGAVVGATVSLSRPGSINFSGLDEGSMDVVLAGEGGPLPGLGSSEKLSAVTDAGGNFLIEGVPEGAYTVKVSAPGYRATWLNTASGAKPKSPSVTVKAGEIATPEAPLTLDAVTSLRATVQGADGSAPTGSVTAELYFRDGDKAGQLCRKVRATVGRHGQVFFSDLPAGSYEVVFSLWGHKPSSRFYAALNDGQTTDVGNVVLEKAPVQPGDDPARGAEPPRISILPGRD